MFTIFTSHDNWRDRKRMAASLTLRLILIGPHQVSSLVMGHTWRCWFKSDFSGGRPTSAFLKGVTKE